MRTTYSMNLGRQIGILVTVLFLCWRADGQERDEGVTAAPRPRFAVVPRSIDFDSVRVGSTVAETLQVSNPGTLLLRVDSITVPFDDMRVEPSMLSLLPGETTSVVLVVSPEQAGTIEDEVLFYHNAFRSPGAVAVHLEAVSPPELVVETPEIDFGIVVVQSEAYNRVVVSNGGSLTLRIDSVSSTLAELSVDSAGIVIGPGASATIGVRFFPVAPGVYEGELKLWHTGEGSPARVLVSGLVVEPAECVVRPDTVTMERLAPGQESKDTVTLLNVGGLPLHLDSIDCAVEGFAVTPGAEQIAPGESTSLVVRFFPLRTGVFGGDAVIYHDAPSRTTTIHLWGEAQALPSFSVGKTSLNFVSVLVGQGARDSLAVSNSGTADLFVDSVLSNTPVFSVEPTAARVAAGATRWFAIEYRPVAVGSDVGVLAFWHSASEMPVRIDLQGSAIAPPGPPELAFPFAGQGDLPSSVTLLWNRGQAATAYRLELSADPAFSRLILSDSLGADTSRTVGRLAYNTTYYWRVSARNAAGWGLPSPAKAFRTASQVPMSASLIFPADSPGPSSYRLVGIPGTDALTVEEFMEGAQGTDWRMFRDNGAASDYLVELSGSFPVSIGEGYWVLKRNPLNVSRSVSMPEVEPDGTSSIPMHPGPNIITNPFDLPVPWASIVEANEGAMAGEVPLTFRQGSYQESGTLEPFVGYYLRNYQNLPRLKVPYPFTEEAELHKPAGVPTLWTLEVSFEGAAGSDRGNVLGVADGARSALDQLDRWKPGPVMDLCYVGFFRPDLDERYPYLRADIRPTRQEGQVWNLELRNPGRAPGTLRIAGVDHVPPQLSVLLVDLKETTPVDLRANSQIAVEPGTARLSLRIIVGSPEYARAELSRYIPVALALLQNYPNPFNPATAIPFTLPQPAVVHLEVISLLGEPVVTLVDAQMPAGLHTVRWDGTDGRGVPVGSGVYFTRLVVNHAVVGTRKLVLLK